MPDGSITNTRDKSLESTHFCLHVINVPQSNLLPNTAPFVYTPPVVSVDEAAPSQPAVSQPAPVAAAVAFMPPAAVASAPSSKEEEAAAYDRYRSEPIAPQPTTETPPTYTNLFPQLPK